LIDIKKNFGTVERNLVENPTGNYRDYDHPARKELRRLQDILNNYRISFIEVKGIQVAEVCQIFERINQAGKPLSIFDIVVAKTFKHETQNSDGFYLRELIDDFKKINYSEFLNIGDLHFLEILAIIINRNIENSGIRNITDRYLNEIKTEQILEVWEDAKKAILKSFDFFENHLHIKTPHLIPFRYFYLTIANYFYKNHNPDNNDYIYLSKYFWYYSFHNDDLLSNTTDLFRHIEFLDKNKQKQPCEFERFLIDKEQLRSSSYSSRGRMSRAILALYASHQPKDWEHCDRDVLVQNLFFSNDNPNLHHVFPTNSEYVLNNRHNNKINSDSLMNIVFLTQITNHNITNRNPLEYIKDYAKPEFEQIMSTHLLPREILEWARNNDLPSNALDLFVEKRVDLIIDSLKKKLPNLSFDVIDTNQNINKL